MFLMYLFVFFFMCYFFLINCHSNLFQILCKHQALEKKVLIYKQQYGQNYIADF